MIYDDNGDEFGELFDRFEGEVEEMPEVGNKPKVPVVDDKPAALPALTPKVRRSMSGKFRQSLERPHRVFKQMEADAKSKRGEELLKAYKETYKPGQLIPHPTLPNTWIEEKIKK